MVVGAEGWMLAIWWAGKLFCGRLGSWGGKVGRALLGWRVGGGAGPRLVVRYESWVRAMRRVYRDGRGLVFIFGGVFWDIKALMCL